MIGANEKAHTEEENKHQYVSIILLIKFNQVFDLKIKLQVISICTDLDILLLVFEHF